ncbi:MAG: hypothetical protein PHQ05_08515 [Sterolibacterium sp.]|nr:hypothetical protein [Sterolibacterium sp.]
MAIRIRNRFHSRGRPRTMPELASVIAMLGWKLAIDSIKRLREVKFDIDLGSTYFDFVCEYLAFLAHVADRIAHRDLPPEQRQAFTLALATRLADVVEDNANMRLITQVPGACRADFIELFNRAGGEYAEFGYTAEGPDFGFRRRFASRVREFMPEKDSAWIFDQVMEIEIPEGIKALERTLAGLFAKA